MAKAFKITQIIWAIILISGLILFFATGCRAVQPVIVEKIKIEYRDRLRVDSVYNRDTAKKIGIYSFAMLGAMAIESIAHAEGTFVAVRTIAIFASVCEFWSMSASMLIIYPNMPFLRIFRTQLKGEIASKLSKNIDVDDIFNDDTNDTEGDKKHSRPRRRQED